MAAEPFRLQVKFWGVRGSTPTPCAENLGYGGNTSCIEIRGGGGEQIIIDAGTGIRALGREMAANGPQDVEILLTHFHWDHIQGLPFFAPLLQAGNRIHFHSFPSAEEMQRRLKQQMSSPFFTLDLDAVGAERQYSQVSGSIQQGGMSVSAFPLNHPQGACGYRIEAGGASVVIATDVEHGNAGLDLVLRENAAQADVLIYDAQYTPAEYATRCGWGHSTYLEGARVGADARVGKLVLFHHDPTHDDEQMSEIAGCCRGIFENTMAARELEIITL